MNTPQTDKAALHDGTVVSAEFARELEREREAYKQLAVKHAHDREHLRDQLERWRELAAFLAACLRDCGTIDSHAWHSRGTALESYERLKTNGAATDL
jgi:hypothetical protein